MTITCFTKLAFITHIAVYLEAMPINIHLGENAKLIAIFQLKFQADSDLFNKATEWNIFWNTDVLKHMFCKV